MADSKQGHGYVGTIPNSGTMSVKAPNQVSKPAKDKVIKGTDLRSGKK